MRDPRSSSRYTKARALWLAGYGGGPAPCVLCLGWVDTSLPGNHPYGPTVEHRVPVRVLAQQSRTWAELVALACDTSTWAVAHRRCQDRQGQRVTAAINRARNERRDRKNDVKSSRVW